MTRRRFHSPFDNWHRGLFTEIVAFSLFLAFLSVMTAAVVLALR